MLAVNSIKKSCTHAKICLTLLGKQFRSCNHTMSMMPNLGAVGIIWPAWRPVHILYLTPLHLWVRSQRSLIVCCLTEWSQSWACLLMRRQLQILLCIGAMFYWLFTAINVFSLIYHIALQWPWNRILSKALRIFYSNLQALFTIWSHSQAELVQGEIQIQTGSECFVLVMVIQACRQSRVFCFSWSRTCRCLTIKPPWSYQQINTKCSIWTVIEVWNARPAENSS